MNKHTAHRAYASFTLYGATRAAVIQFAKGFSNDLLPRKIRATIILPGTTDTPVFDRFVPAEQLDALVDCASINCALK